MVIAIMRLPEEASIAGAFGGAVGAIAGIGLEGVSPAIALPAEGAASGLAEAGLDHSSVGCMVAEEASAAPAPMTMHSGANP